MSDATVWLHLTKRAHDVFATETGTFDPELLARELNLMADRLEELTPEEVEQIPADAADEFFRAAGEVEAWVRAVLAVDDVRRERELLEPEVQTGSYTKPVGRECILYRAYGESGELLYVGITEELCQRMAGHSRDSEWWPLAARLDWQMYPNRLKAAKIERALIRGLQPPYNIQSR